MNPLTEEELQELASLLPHVTVEWSAFGRGQLWVARRVGTYRYVQTPQSERAQELIGPQSAHINYDDGAHRQPRPGVVEILSLFSAVHEPRKGPRFPD